MSAGRTLSRWLGGGLFIAIADQGALSLFSFALNLYLIRALDSVAYGAFALWISVALLVVSVQNATVSTPLSVYVPAQRDRGLARRLEGAIGTVNWLLIGTAVIAAGMAGLVLNGAWVPGRLLALAIPAYIGATLLREFTRGSVYARSRTVDLPHIDGVYLAVATAGLVVAIGTRAITDHLLAVVFLAMAAGALAGGVVGLLRLRRLGAVFWSGDWYSGYKAIRGEVGWSVAGVVATHGQARSYVYVVSALAGPESLAAVFALGILFQPVRLIAEAWTRVARPRLARCLAAQETAAVRRILGQGLLLLLASHAALTLTVVGLWAFVESVVLGGRYDHAADMILPWAVVTFAYLSRVTVSVLLQAARAFRRIFLAIFLSAMVTLFAASVFTIVFGYEYCLYGLAIGEVLCLLVLLRTALPLCRSAGTGR